MTREEILSAAKKCVCGDRDQQYGSPENSFKVIANLWFSYLHGKKLIKDGVYILAEDVAAMMALFKIARIATGQNKEDNWIDIAGYAACGGEVQSGGSND